LSIRLPMKCPRYRHELHPSPPRRSSDISQTFEGHTIASLLTEKLEWRIRNNGMQMPLAASKEVPLDPRWVEASKANAGKTSINKEACRVEGWGAGAPFPNIDENDPQAA